MSEIVTRVEDGYESAQVPGKPQIVVAEKGHVGSARDSDGADGLNTILLAGAVSVTVSADIITVMLTA